MPTDPLSTLVLATGGAFLGKFVGPAAEALGKPAWERAQQLGQQATAYLTAVGREPRPVEPKLLLPLVQAAALETDEALAEKWAALLANAADPAQRVAVQPSFVEVLRQLTPLDAQVLSFVYEWGNLDGNTPFGGGDTLNISTVFAQFAQERDRMELSLDNLLRLRLFAMPIAGFGAWAAPDGIITPTMYGGQFLVAVTSPS